MKTKIKIINEFNKEKVNFYNFNVMNAYFLR